MSAHAVVAELTRTVTVVVHAVVLVAKDVDATIVIVDLALANKDVVAHANVAETVIAVAHSVVLVAKDAHARTALAIVNQLT